MNAIFPVQLLPVRERSFLYALLGVLFLAWIIMMFAAANLASGASTGIRNVFAAAVLLSVMTGAIQMKALARAREFAAALSMPETLWRSWMRICIVETSVMWALTGAAMSALLAERGSTMPWPAGAALISAGLCIGSACSLHWQSMISKSVGGTTQAIGVALILAVLCFGAGRVLASIAAWPLPVLVLMSLSWPALAVRLLRTGPRQLAVFRSGQVAARKPLLARLDSQMRRYSPLDYSSGPLPRWAPEHANAGVRIGWLFSASFPVYIYFNSLAPLGWNEEPDARHLMSLAALCLLMTPSLMARDLHWRSLLMPGGWQRGRIATGIFNATLKIQYVAFGMAILISVLYQRLLQVDRFEHTITAMANHTMLLGEVAFAIGAAVVIRALPRYKQFMLASGLLLGGCWLYVRFVVGYAHLSHWPAGALMYASLMTLATWLMLRLANRLWTPEKLMACARANGGH